MIDSGTQLGLNEVGSDQRTQDYEEVAIIPQMKALTAVNPNSVLIPVNRISGVTTVIAAPDGDLIPGTAALIISTAIRQTRCTAASKVGVNPSQHRSSRGLRPPSGRRH